MGPGTETQVCVEQVVGEDSIAAILVVTLTGGRSPRPLRGWESPRSLPQVRLSIFLPAWTGGTGGFSQLTLALSPLLSASALSSQQPPQLQAAPCDSLVKFRFPL